MNKCQSSIWINSVQSICLGFGLALMMLIAFFYVLHIGIINSTLVFAIIISIFIGLCLGFVLIYIFPKLCHWSIIIYLLTAASITGCLSPFLFSFFIAKVNLLVTDGLFVLFLGANVTIPLVLFGILIGSHVEKTSKIMPVTAILATGIIGIIFALILSAIGLFTFVSPGIIITLIVASLLIVMLMELSSISAELIPISLAIAIFLLTIGINQTFSRTSWNKFWRSPVGEKYLLATPQKSFIAAMLSQVNRNAANSSNIVEESLYLSFIHQVLLDNLTTTNHRVLILASINSPLSQLTSSGLTLTYIYSGKKHNPSACNFLDILSKGDTVFSRNQEIPWRFQHGYAAVVTGIFHDQLTSLHPWLTYQTLLKIKKYLIKNGIAIINVIANPTLTDINSKRTDNTIRAVFPNCMSVPMVYANRLSHIIYLCRKSEKKNNHILIGFQNANFSK